MEHLEANDLFDAYFSGKLDRETTRAFHAHINSCEDCKVKIRAMRAHGKSLFRSPMARGGFDPESDQARLQAQLYRNRVITYAVIAVLIMFFILFRLRRP